jgi:transcriptional regulator with XRE-family HTH domain
MNFSIGTRLRFARIARNMTQSQAAKGIGMSVHSIRYYERDKIKPKLGTIKKLAELYSIPLEDLITAEELICLYPTSDNLNCVQ